MENDTQVLAIAREEIGADPRLTLIEADGADFLAGCAERFDFIYADAWPGTDLILMQALIARDPSMAKAAALRARAEAWRPYRAYAALHVWNEIADQAGSAKGG